jgi:hypothetical protein
VAEHSSKTTSTIIAFIKTPSAFAYCPNYGTNRNICNIKRASISQPLLRESLRE